MGKTITEDFVSFEIAKLLKEKGFDEPCRSVYEEKILRVNTMCDYFNSELSSYVCAPTLQMAMKWLREVHKIDIDILSRLSLNADDDHCYSYVIKHQYDKYAFKTYTDGEYQYFEDAVEAALIYCLENLI